MIYIKDFLLKSYKGNFLKETLLLVYIETLHFSVYCFLCFLIYAIKNKVEMVNFFDCGWNTRKDIQSFIGALKVIQP